MKNLSSLASQVRLHLEPLAAINADASAEHDGWSYRRMYVQPNYRLGETLLTSRELLVVVSEFANVQARHIKMVEKELARAGGRLESGMAIVVHQDPDGNPKLRDWGRERGLTILPICGAPAVPKGQALEQALCEGIYSHDPFDLTGPVRSVHQFFGRPDVPDVARRLRSGHIQALFGIRKIGKTSVLNRVQAEAINVHGMACAMADLSDDSLSRLDAGALLDAIVGAVEEALRNGEDGYARVVPRADVASASEAANTLIELLVSSERPVLLMLDEIDYISPSSPLAPQWRGEFNVFFRALRQVYQECARRSRPFSVMLCGVSSHWFSVEEIEGIENAALAFVPETYLPPLERRQSVQMVQTVGRSAGLIFDNAAANELAATASDIPFWIRRAGSFINSCYDLENRPITIDVEDVAMLCREFVEADGAKFAFSSLRHLFRIYPQLGVTAVDVMNGRRIDRTPQALLSTLGRYGILGEGVQPSGPMVEAGLRQWESEHYEESLTLPLEYTESTTTVVAAGSVSAAGEEEWASLLSEVSVRRNICERDLRDLVLTVVRVEVAQRSDGRTPADVLVFAMQHDRRDEQAGKPATAVAKAMLWSELINVIKRNWTWFEQIFDDRKQLELWAGIVNDRPDAHAKDLDGAELALQRRAISWIHERVTAAGVL